MAGQARLIKIEPYSDGNSANIPNMPDRILVNPPPILYLERLGTLWMKHQGKNVNGVTYRIDRLPEGYTVWERPRLSDPSHVDRWCYGHPSGKFFDSPNKFATHFINLMEKGSSQGCSCVNCSRPGSVKSAKGQTSSHWPRLANTGIPRSVMPSRTATFPSHLLANAKYNPLPITDSTTNPTTRETSEVPATTHQSASGAGPGRGRPRIHGKVDEEGTPDPYRNSIDRLSNLGSLATLIEENMSADWRAERASKIDAYFRDLAQKPTSSPRRLEIVLFIRHMEPHETLTFDDTLRRFVIRPIDNITSADGRDPNWECGIVTQIAQNREDADSYRIEPISNANSKENKGIWKGYKYLRIDQLRPFNLWKTFLSGTDNSLWDETINNALLVMSTVTLVKRYRFKGKWPTASIYCRAMYLGSELIAEGDFVYLLPKAGTSDVSQIMQIQNITLDLSHLDRASGDDWDDGHPYNSQARITGVVYTNDSSDTPEDDTEIVFLDDISHHLGLDRVGPWYRHTPTAHFSKVPFHRVLGRCKNSIVMDLWVHGRQEEGPLTQPGMGLNGVLKAREHSTRHHRRIEQGKRWFWADTRVEALDLEEINGYDVSAHDVSRDPKKYRSAIRLVDGKATPKDVHRSGARTSVRGRGGMLQAVLDEDEVMESTETSTDRKRSADALSEADGNSPEEDEESEGGDSAQPHKDPSSGIDRQMDNEVVSVNSESEASESEEEEDYLVVVDTPGAGAPKPMVYI